MDKKHQTRYEDLTLLPRRWFPLPRLDFYILREFLIKYSVLLLVFIILFILGDVYRDISDFLENKASVSDILLYLAYKQPGNIRFILPISMLLGCMWTMATFGKNMEITAMRASGVSLFRCGGSIFVVGLAVTFINIYFNEALVPFTERSAEIIRSNATERRRYVRGLLTYRSNDQQRHWLFNNFTTGNIQNDVTLKTFWTDGMIDSLVLVPDEAARRRMILEIFPGKAERLLSLSRAEMEKQVRRELVGRKVDFYGREAAYDPENETWIFRNGNFISYDRNDDTRFSASTGTSADGAALSEERNSGGHERYPERRQGERRPADLGDLGPGAAFAEHGGAGQVDLYDGVLLPAGVSVGLLSGGVPRHPAGDQERADRQSARDHHGNGDHRGLYRRGAGVSRARQSRHSEPDVRGAGADGGIHRLRRMAHLSRQELIQQRREDGI